MYTTIINKFLGIFGKDERIIGGHTTRIRLHPFVAAFRYSWQDVIFCGGSIISVKHILTAAHCFYYENYNYSQIKVYTGITFTRSTSGQENQIVQVFIHPWFTGLVSPTSANQHDIAIVLVRHF
jgi:secreted trypsin-like serine protease